MAVLDGHHQAGAQRIIGDLDLWRTELKLAWPLDQDVRTHQGQAVGGDIGDHLAAWTIRRL